MGIGINDFDDLDYEEGQLNNDDTTTQDIDDQGKGQTVQTAEPEPSQSEPGPQEEDFISYMLKAREIEDRTKIKYEEEDGSESFADWDSLSNEEKLAIIDNSARRSSDDSSDLDDEELQLISAIRTAKMSPAQYLEWRQQEAVNTYRQNAEPLTPYFRVDDFEDDDLYLNDVQERLGVTEEEAQQLLNTAKSDEALFQKQVKAIRDEYKQLEIEQLEREKAEKEQLAVEQYNLFSQSIVDQINEFKEFAGYTVDMDESDMDELYEFITGFDAANNNHFAKALADPKVVVQMAWFALNGTKLIEQIDSYYKDEITKARESGYAEGVAKAQKKDKTNTVVRRKPVPNNNNHIADDSDLDD